MSQFAGLGLPLLHAGKVRELYALEDPGLMLMVATDNVSAYDHVLDSPIPDKGVVLTQLSVWWFEQLDDLVANHVVSTEVPAEVAGRALVVERLEMVPIEAVARGYLTGSGWAEYLQSGAVTGIELPSGLHDGSRLPTPIFTPARKAPLAVIRPTKRPSGSTASAASKIASSRSIATSMATALLAPMSPPAVRPIWPTMTSTPASAIARASSGS